MSDLLCATCLHEHPSDTSSVAVTIIDGAAVCRPHALAILARHDREMKEHDHELEVARYRL